MFLEEFRERVKEWDPGKHMVLEERNGLIEAFHDAHIAVVNNRGELLHSSGDPVHITYTRSCIKPIQALPLLYTGAAEHYGFTDEEIAIISGSHSGEPRHLEVVRSIMMKAGIEESLLKCRGHAPFNKEQAAIVGKDFTSIHDNCSGKHAGALAACRFNSWDLDSYIEIDHPLTEEVIDSIAELTNLQKNEIHVGSDGCDIPNFAIPIDRMAQLFALLADPGNSDRSEQLRRLGNAMMDHPDMVAGTDRFDTVLMRDFPGKVLSKAGAVGLQTLAASTDEGWLGISIKVPDGAYTNIIPVLTYHVLSELGLKNKGSNRYNNPMIRTRSDKVVGAVHSFGKLKKH
ncbi:MAG: asparaginase [Thermoplasmatota archaeon]